MLRYIVKRLLFMLVTLSCTIIFVFTLLEFTPGDPAKIILGQTANEEALEAIRIQFHLNDPYIVRLGRYFLQLLHGDLGVEEHGEGHQQGKETNVVHAQDACAPVDYIVISAQVLCPEERLLTQFY